MFEEKVGTIAGLIWEALNGKEEIEAKQLKKMTKLTDKDLFLGLGWLLREDKVFLKAIDKDLFISLK